MTKRAAACPEIAQTCFASDHIILTGDFNWNSGAAERSNARTLHLRKTHSAHHIEIALVSKRSLQEGWDLHSLQHDKSGLSDRFLPAMDFS